VGNNGVIGLVLAIAAMSTSCFPLGFVGMWFGAKARRAARDAGDPGGTEGTLGLIAMIVGGIFGGLWALFWIFELVMIVFGFGMVFWAASSTP
jgi:hypothetical protein